MCELVWFLLLHRDDYIHIKLTLTPLCVCVYTLKLTCICVVSFNILEWKEAEKKKNISKQLLYQMGRQIDRVIIT